MRRWWIAALLIGGCASTGQYDPDVAAHIAADATCVAQLALDGFNIYAMPAFGGPVTAAHVVQAITQATSVSQQAVTACGQTLKYAGYDISALKAKIAAKKKPVPISSRS